MCRTTALIGRLSADERSALIELGDVRRAHRRPGAHADALLRFGFIEVVCGAQELTNQGRRALRLLRA
ncbi:MAG: hypothetical protein AAGI34_18455 [Pseudomonadota bacterium]